MKKILRTAAIVALTALIALCAVSCKSDDTPKGMIKASNEKADFTLYVPEKWTVDVAEADVSAHFSSDDPSSVAMMAWDVDYSDTSLDDWWSYNLSELEKVFADVEIVSDENMTIDGNYAKRITYEASLGGERYKFMQVACISKSSVYVFTYTSVPESFDEHTEDVDSMLTYLTIGK